LKTIHKFILNGTRGTVFTSRAGGKIISAGIQGIDQFVVWIEIDTSVRDLQQYSVDVYGTGWEMPENPGRFIATVQECGGFVWHIYEK
jgi:hypothetical protein